MFNIGATEAAVIGVAALLILGPKKLPELARGLGRALRELRRQTHDVRSLVEREFYRLDEAPSPPAQQPPREHATATDPEGPQPARDAVAMGQSLEAAPAAQTGTSAPAETPADAPGIPPAVEPRT